VDRPLQQIYVENGVLVAQFDLEVRDEQHLFDENVDE